jgi:hypothetical protein
VRAAAILRHDEIATGRVGERFRALQFRARRGLEARQQIVALRERQNRDRYDDEREE